MSNEAQDLQAIIHEAEDAIAKAENLQALDQLRTRFLGKKGQLTDYLKSLGQLPPEERPRIGQAVNQVKVQLQEIFSARENYLKLADLENQLVKERVDVTLPGRAQNLGSLHPITRAKERIELFFRQMGFRIDDGPEIETEYYNFDALNIPAHHPARAMHDTFYLAPDKQHPNPLLLRTHTSNVQIRVMEHNKPPLKTIALGRVYRCDSDVTHSPMFHQLEGLVVNKNVSMADLKGMLEAFMRFFFEKDLAIRLRPSYFPFTEPSAEMDLQCVLCEGKGTDCRICKQTGWLEVGGAGMVHPNVLEGMKIDSQQYSGYAFGFGLDRLVMLRYGISDLRTLFDNDVRFLKQF